MNLFSRKRPRAATFSTTPPPTPAGTLITPPGWGVQDEWTTPEILEQVGAVVEARRLVCDVPGMLLPLHATDAASNPRTLALLEQMEAGRATPLTLAACYRDMAYHGFTLLRKTRRDTRNYPLEVERIARWRVGFDYGPNNVLRGVTIDGEDAPWDTVIFVEYPGVPWCRALARPVRTLLALDDATRAYARNPQPRLVLSLDKDVAAELAKEDPAEDGTERLAAEMTGIGNAWRDVGRTGGAAVLAGVTATPVGWSPEELELGAAKDAAIREIGRVTGVDPSAYLSAPAQGTSLTYSSSESRRRDLVDLAQSPIVLAFAARLSMGDVTPRGTKVRPNLDAFLRGDTLGRYQAHEIGLRAGFLEVPEVRALEDRPALPRRDAPPAAPAAP